MTRIAHCHSFGPHKGRSHVLIAFHYRGKVFILTRGATRFTSHRCGMAFKMFLLNNNPILEHRNGTNNLLLEFFFPFFLFLVFILPHLHSSPCSGDQAVLFVLWKLSIFAVCCLFVKLLVRTRVNSCPWCIRKAVADGQNWRRPCAFRL